MKCFFLGLSILFVQGCVYRSYTTKLDNSIPRERVNHTQLITNNSSDEGIYSATIGDELFILKRITIGSSNTVVPRAPTGNSFPQGEEWAATYKYNDGKSGDIYVYTTPSYYGGSIGVLLDKNEKLQTKKPLVQLSGAKEGRRWAINGLYFFKPTNDSWALRYGGLYDGAFTLEIVNKIESSTSEVLQKINVSEADFYKGFVIRNILIKGVSTDEYGAIKFTVLDMLEPQT